MMRKRTSHCDCAGCSETSIKPGNKVVMNDRYHVSAENARRVWTVRSEPWMCCGTLVVALEGKAGGYAVDGLDLVEENTHDPLEFEGFEEIR